MSSRAARRFGRSRASASALLARRFAQKARELSAELEGEGGGG